MAFILGVDTTISTANVTRAAGEGSSVVFSNVEIRVAHDSFERKMKVDFAYDSVRGCASMNANHLTILSDVMCRHVFLGAPGEQKMVNFAVALEKEFARLVKLNPLLKRQ